MGQCKICHKSTKFNLKFCWTHFYFNFTGSRLYMSIFLTFLLEIFLSKIGWVDEWTVWTLFTDSLYKTTNYIPFLILKIIIIIAIPFGTFFAISKGIYKKLRID